ncbi:type II secretion system F family protein [Paenibacillus sp. GCM10027626]|uniref:type II secretion system F family protein n=1 Tax=Paenibacillus sp. GCM10027626 TaxID=3273411 RepID=UPI0036423FEC
MAIVASVVLTAIWVAAAVSCSRQANAVQSHGGRDMRQRAEEWRWITLPFRYLLERGKVWDKLQPFLAEIHGKLLILNGSSWSIEATRQYISTAVGYGYAALWGGGLLSLLSGENGVLYMGVLIGIIVPLARLREVSRKVERRKQDILLLLPDLLSKLLLLLGAGETVQRALIRCMTQTEGADPADPNSTPHPLVVEMRRMNEALRNGESFAAAIESFSRRCAVQEVSLFTTTLLLNYRRGGDKLALSLKELVYTLWEKRKAIARTRGEEASSKLVFPLVGIFIVLMVVVASPAMLLMAG